MGKQLASSTQIERQSKPSSLVLKSAVDEKKELLANYMEKYAIVAGRAITPQLLAVFYEALEDVPLNRLKAGLKQYLREGVRFPWPNDIREMSEL
jgi:hypothetical protein